MSRKKRSARRESCFFLLAARPIIKGSGTRCTGWLWYYQTTREAVERSIRTLISVMWDKNPELFWKLFGYPRWWKPSAGELIAAMSQYIKVRE